MHKQTLLSILEFFVSPRFNLDLRRTGLSFRLHYMHTCNATYNFIVKRDGCIVSIVNDLPALEKTSCDKRLSCQLNVNKMKRHTWSVATCYCPLSSDQSRGVMFSRSHSQSEPHRGRNRWSLLKNIFFPSYSWRKKENDCKWLEHNSLQEHSSLWSYAHLMIYIWWLRTE